MEKNTKVSNEHEINLSFEEILKPKLKYDSKALNKNDIKKILFDNFINNERILKTKKQNIYKSFLLNNAIFGFVIEIWDLFSSDIELRKEFILNLFSNAFSKFDDNMNIDISVTNEYFYNFTKEKTKIENLELINNYNELFSKKDFAFLELKNLEKYEFIYQWKNINAIINIYFELAGQKEIGNYIAKLFLLSYELKKDLEDFISSSLVLNENLSEDFINNKIYILLNKVYKHLIAKETDKEIIKKVFANLLSAIPYYQIEKNKNNHFKNLFKTKKNKEKFRLFISDEIISEIGTDIKVISTKLKNKSENFDDKNVFKIDEQNFKFTISEINDSKFAILKSDKIDYLSALSETYFKSNKLSFNKYKTNLLIIKLATLAYMYSCNNENKNKKFRNSQKLFEYLILKKAAIKSDEFCSSISQIMSSKNHQDKFVEENLPNNYENNEFINKLINIISFIYKEMNLNQEIALNSIRYYILKNEIYDFENSKKSKKSKSIFILEGIDLSIASKWQNQFINNLESEFKAEKSSIHVRYIRFMTETYGKLYLLDKPPMTNTQKVALLFTYLILVCWSLIIILPILQVVIQALNWYSSNASTGTIENPGSLGVFDFSNFRLSTANFRYLFSETMFSDWLINSVVIATISMLCMVFVVALIGYAFSRFRFKGKKIGLMTVMLIQMIPTISSFVAFYILLQILNQWIGVTGPMMLVIIYIGGGIPGNVFVLKGYMDNISMDIDEAAKIDGCGNWTIFTRIMVPLSKPMLSVIALWSFIGPFGDVLLPQVLLADISQYTMATGLRTLLSSGTVKAQGAFAAGSLIVAIPITGLFLFLQKNITGGLSAAGVKG